MLSKAASAQEGQRKVADYTCQDLANTAPGTAGLRGHLALAVLQPGGFRLSFGGLVAEAMAFAKPNIYHGPFLEAIAQHAARKMRQFEAREVSNALWSLTILGRDVVGPEWLDVALEHFLDLIRKRHYEGWELVQVVNACWPHRRALRWWDPLERTFHDRVFGSVVSALEAIIGRDQGLLGMSDPIEEPVEVLPQKLLNAGPATHGSLSAAKVPRLSPLEAARRGAQKLIDQLQVDFLGPVFTRVAMRDLGFIDPQDFRATQAFGRSGQEATDGPDWGRVARASVAECLAKMRQELSFMWFDRFGPHERRVISWTAYQLKVEISSQGGPLAETLTEGGRICAFSLDEHRAMDKRGMETFARLESKWKSKGCLAQSWHPMQLVVKGYEKGLQ